MVERNWRRFRCQCLFFLVQWWKTYKLFFNSCNRGRIRVGIVFMKDCHQTVKLLSVTKILFRQKHKSTHTMTSLREDTTLIFEKSSHKQSTPRWGDEDFSRGSYKRIVREDYFKFKYSHPLKLKTFWPSECSTLTDCNWNLTSQALAFRPSLRQRINARNVSFRNQFKFSTDFIKPNYLIILFWSVFLFVSTHCRTALFRS